MLKQKTALDVTILCKVVDNFGDIGVVCRLARALSAYPNLKMRIVVDNLHSFALLEPDVQPDSEQQDVKGIRILNWNAAETCLREFRSNPPRIIIECFQCGRPDWLETLLFDETVPNIVNIIMLDYLSAEPYTETFHRLQSLTRSARVQKVNFMPGFTPKTGGLILDRAFLKSLKRGACPSLPRQAAPRMLPASRSILSALLPCPLPPLLGDTPKTPDSPFPVLFFSYSGNQSPLVSALQTFSVKKRRAVHILLAQGAGFDSFKTAFNNAFAKDAPSAAGKTLFLTELPFLPQTEWDALLCRTPLLFVRGEDSLSRACLCGVPFVWHAYPQSEDYQLVKVQALLDRMRPHFPAEHFKTVENCWRTYNGAPGNLESSVTEFLLLYDELLPCFRDFSASLLQNGDLAAHLVEFMRGMLHTSDALRIM